MTWTANCTVQDVSDGPGPIDVLAVANADETVRPYAHLTGSPHQDHEQPAVISNTEGKIRSVEVRLVLDEDETKLKPGDIIAVTGHFDSRS